MSTLTKVFVVLTSVLAIAVSCLFIAAAAQWDNWRALGKTYQSQAQSEFVHRANLAASSEAALAMMRDDMAKLQKQLADEQGKGQTLADDLAKAQGELARARNESSAFEAGRTKLQEILDVTSAQLQALEKQNQTLVAQNMDLQTRNTRLNSRNLELTANVTILTDQTRNLQEKLYACEQGGTTTSVRSSRVSDSPAGVVPVSPTVKGPINGQVTDIDGAYASINVGESSGVTPGMAFMIWREGSGYVAELVVDRVRPQEAGGKLQFIKGQVRKGDPASFGLDN